MEQIAEHFQLQPGSKSQVGRSAGYESNALYGVYKYMRPQRVYHYGVSAVFGINFGQFGHK